jgi:hypothetical protein
MRDLLRAVACCLAIGCAGGASDDTRCRTTQDCRGGSFCDRGTCAPTDTQVFGHGYGAQCLPEAAYPSPADLAVHCRGRSCIDGHCSSCVDDSECTQPHHKCIVQPGIAGKTCEAMPVDHTNNREDLKPELPPTPLLENPAHDCEHASDCRGDHFCDRGRCAVVIVDSAGPWLRSCLSPCRTPEPRQHVLGFYLRRWLLQLLPR